MTDLNEIIATYNRIRRTRCKPGREYQKRQEELRQYITAHLQDALPDAKKIDAVIFEYPLHPEYFDGSAPEADNFFFMNKDTGAVIGLDAMIHLIDKDNNLHNVSDTSLADPNMRAVRVQVKPFYYGYAPDDSFQFNYKTQMTKLARLGAILSGKDNRRITYCGAAYHQRIDEYIEEQRMNGPLNYDTMIARG